MWNKMGVPAKALLTISLILIFFSNAQAVDFPFGIYGAWSFENYDKAFSVIKEKGFNIVADQSSQRQVLDKSHNYNLMGIVSFNLTDAVAKDERLLSKFEQNMVKKVAELKDHPAVFGWYIVDEPNLRNLDPNVVQRMYNKLKSVDKKKPVYTYLGYPGNWGPYIKSTDIIGVSGYLRKGEKSEVIRQRIQRIRQDIQTLNLKKKVWLVLQAFEVKSKTKPSPYKSISVSEFRESWSIAFEEKIDGLLVYTLGFLPRQPDTDVEPFTLPVDRPDIWGEIDKLKLKITTSHKNRKD